MGNPSRKVTSNSTVVLDATLGELLLFVQWMERAVQAANHGHPLPDAPPLDDGTVKRWTDLIRRLAENVQRAEASYLALQETLTEQEASLGPSTSNLCENLAATYDTLGQPERAQAVRMRVAALYVS